MPPPPLAAAGRIPPALAALAERGVDVPALATTINTATAAVVANMADHMAVNAPAMAAVR